MHQILMIIILGFSGVCFAQQSHEDFVHSRLFGIIADTEAMGPRAVRESLDQAIESRKAIEPLIVREEVYSELGDRILGDPRWVTSDKVTRAARNFVEVLIEQENTGLLLWFQYQLERINKAIDAGWTELYRGEGKTNSRGNGVPQEKLRRHLALVEVHEKIKAYRQEKDLDLFSKGALQCVLLIAKPFKPQL